MFVYFVSPQLLRQYHEHQSEQRVTEILQNIRVSDTLLQSLRTFARKSSNIDFFIKLLLQLGYELLLPEMQKTMGGHRLTFEDKISERTP